MRWASPRATRESACSADTTCKNNHQRFAAMFYDYMGPPMIKSTLMQARKHAQMPQQLEFRCRCYDKQLTARHASNAWKHVWQQKLHVLCDTRSAYTSLQTAAKESYTFEDHVHTSTDLTPSTTTPPRDGSSRSSKLVLFGSKRSFMTYTEILDERVA